MDHFHKPFNRSERVGEQIKNKIANIFIKNISLPEAGLLTVTHVSMTADLKIAKIYISCLENKAAKDQIISLLNNRQNEFKYFLGNSIDLKYVPELRFYYDNSMEQAEYINRIIDKIQKHE